MANYITIDGGTTNTRVNLVRDNNIIKTVKIKLGARAGIDGNQLLKEKLKEAIEECLHIENNVNKILASGMITSEYGLYNVPHITTPAGIYELNNSMVEVVLNDISEIPFVFVSGVKNNCNTFEKADMMRGEETELMGLTEQLEPDCMYVLPGSHSKLIFTDSKGRISEFSTQLTGELLEAVANNTILKTAIDLNQSSFDEIYLDMGYTYAVNKGINEALFKVRILKNLFNCNNNQVYSFFIGVVLSSEIMNIINSDAKKVIVGGKRQLQLPMVAILNKHSQKEVVCIAETVANNASTYGIINIYEVSI